MAGAPKAGIFSVDVDSKSPIYLQPEYANFENAELVRLGSGDFVISTFGGQMRSVINCFYGIRNGSMNSAWPSINGDLGNTRRVQQKKPKVSVQSGTFVKQSGEVLELNASISGVPACVAQWQKDGIDVPGQTNRLLRILNIQKTSKLGLQKLLDC